MTPRCDAVFYQRPRRKCLVMQQFRRICCPDGPLVADDRVRKSRGAQVILLSRNAGNDREKKIAKALVVSLKGLHDLLHRDRLDAGHVLKTYVVVSDKRHVGVTWGPGRFAATSRRAWPFYFGSLIFQKKMQQHHG